MIHIIGYEPGASQAWLKDLFERATLIFASERFSRSLPALKEKLRPLVPLDTMFQQIRQVASQEEIVVLASGDPLFFGIGRRFLREFSKEQLLFYPALTSIQRACAHFKMPWDDMDFVSLHGKGASNFNTLIERILRRQNFKVALFTDNKNTPDSIAKILMAKGLEKARLFVAEDMGGPQEAFWELSLEEAAQKSFHPLNLLIITGCHQRRNYQFGLAETEFSHEKGLITKWEVRSVILSMLNLQEAQLMWDIGAGSGSISIEASLLAPGLSIFSIEKDQKRCRDIALNKRKFTALNMEIVCARAPECLETLPKPDRIFIGGGLLTTGLLERCWALLSEGGILVASTILIESLHEAINFSKKIDKEPELVQVSAGRGKRLGAGHYLAAGQAISIWKICK